MKRCALLVALASLALLAPGTASSATACDRVAATNGSDSAAGSAAAPFRTAQRLVNSLASGQTGCLRGGTYSQDQEIVIGRAGISLQSYPGERATLRGRLWVSESGDNVTVSDLNLDGTNQWVLPSPTVNGSDVAFRGNDVTNNHTAICFLLGSSDGYGRAYRTLIEGNRIHNCGLMPAQNHDHGIYIEASTGAVIRNNWIYDNADRGIQLFPDADDTRITGNVIDGNGQGIIFSGYGSKVSSGNVVERNVISNSVVRHNVESYYDDGDPVGSGNLIRQNCVHGARGWYAQSDGSGIQDPQVGFSAVDNMVEAPQFVDRAGKDFTLAPGSRCARLVSGSLTVGIKLEAGRRKVRVNQPLPLRGSTSGAEPGARVTLAVKARRGWATLGRVTVRANGTFGSRVRVGSRRIKVARLRASVTGLGTSSPVKVRVKRR